MHTQQPSRNVLMLLTTIAVALLSNSSSLADTIRVPGDYSTIQAAIDAASDGDAVVVDPGVYSGPGNRNMNFFGKRIVLRSKDRDPRTCIIDLERSGHRAFLFENGEDHESIVNGFTIQHGYAAGGGAVIYTRYESGPLFRNCIFFNNRADDNSGVLIELAGDTRFERCMFVGNFSGGPGGVASLSAGSTTTFESCIFAGNAAATEGGAIVSYSSRARVIGCTFYGNTAGGTGSAIHATGDAFAFLIRNCIFRENTESEITWTGQTVPNVQYTNARGWDGTRGNIDADPLFRDPDGKDNMLGTPDDNFRLGAGSPCIDAGTGLEIEVERNADLWKDNAHNWEAYAFDEFFPGIPNGTGNLAESGVTLQLKGGTVTLRHVNDSGSGTEQPYALKDGSSTSGQVSDGDLSSIDGTMIMEFDPPITAFYSYYASLHQGTDGFIRMWSKGRVISQFFGPISRHSVAAFGHGFTSLIPIDRVDFVSWDNEQGGSVMGAFIGVYPGDSALGTLNIPGYDGPNGETVDLDFGVSFGCDTLPKDAAGNIRGADGNNDGVPLPDMGAYEFASGSGNGDDARLRKFIIKKGEHLSGGTGALRRSDNRRVKFRSEPANNAHVLNTTVNFKSDASNAQSLDVMVESKINQPNGTTIILIRNWTDGGWDELGRFAVGLRQSIGSIHCTLAAKYVKSNGKIQIRVKQVVTNPQGGDSFKSWIDHIAVNVRQMIY